VEIEGILAQLTVVPVDLVPTSTGFGFADFCQGESQALIHFSLKIMIRKKYKLEFTIHWFSQQ